MNVRGRMAIAAVLGSLVLSSCASLSFSSIPLPGSSYRDGYDIVAEFANVLNLPDRAKVLMDGTKVGGVTNVGFAGNHIDVTLRIDGDVLIPSNIHAVLQQATVLGDINVVLERPQDAESTPPLGPGDRIALTQTTSPPPLENTLANLANFIGSGSIQRVQTTLVGINRVTPPRDEVRRVVGQMTTDLEDLSNNITTVDQLISSVSETATVLGARTPEVTAILSEDGVAAIRRNNVGANLISTLLPALGSIYSGGYWLAPSLNSLAGATEAIVGSKRIVEEEYPAYRRFLTDYYLPQDKYPAINITSIVGPDGRELSGNVEQVLRMLGALP